MRDLILQQIAFQLVWLACAMGGASGRPWPGIAASGIFLAWRLRRTGDRGTLAALCLASVITGATLDVVLVGGGWLIYASGSPEILASPFWILALWAAFAPTIPVAFRWLRDRPWLGAALGGLGGALATGAGQQLGALTISNPSLVGWAPVVAVWALALPALVALSARLEASRASRPATPAASAGSARGSASRRLHWEGTPG